jgi:hypothetical protein
MRVTNPVSLLCMQLAASSTYPSLSESVWMRVDFHTGSHTNPCLFHVYAGFSMTAMWYDTESNRESTSNL